MGHILELVTGIDRHDRLEFPSGRHSTETSGTAESEDEVKVQNCISVQSLIVSMDDLFAYSPYRLQSKSPILLLKKRILEVYLEVLLMLGPASTLGPVD